MCGLIVVENHESLVSKTPSNILQHRGPDACQRTVAGEFAFDHYRLSIIDPTEGANQPFIKHPDYVLAYNGEIFNFQRLRAEFSATEYQTDCDTEVLYEGLIEHGREVLNRLNGMFAFVFYDKKKHVLWGARDRFGVKPLYYAFTGSGNLALASEQKALFPLLEERKTRTNALAEYFAYKFIQAPNTLVENVFELPPGCCFEYDLTEKKFTVSSWYALCDRRSERRENLTEEVESLLYDSIKIRLISDVPIGLQLSGGVDSSLIAHMAKSLSGKHFKSFNISFPESPHDENEFALGISQRLNTEHFSIPFTEQDFLALWKKGVYHQDEPLNHPHSLPIMKLTEVAKQEVTVLLSGEGADEVFLGYEHYANMFRHADLASINQARMFLPEEQVRQILDFPVTRELMLGERRGLEDYPGENYCSYYDFKTHLVTLLNRIDKMSMANSLEVRTPFLDYRLVELGLSEHMASLYGEGYRKRPLMELYEKYFADNLSRRPKVGFRVPFDDWLDARGPVWAFCLDILSQFQPHDGINQDKVRSVAASLERGQLQATDYRLVWVLVNFALWKDIFRIR